MVIYRHKDKYSISEICLFFKVFRSGYYGHVSRMDLPAKALPLAEKIQECQERCGRTYGYRRVHTHVTIDMQKHASNIIGDFINYIFGGELNNG